MSWSLIALILIILLVALLVVFRKNPYVKKYWKYSLILAPGVIVILLRLLLIWKEKKQTTADNAGAKTLSNTIAQISKDIKETQLTSAVEVAIAKTKSADTIQKLEEIKKVTDQDEKIKQLAALVG
jgi:glucan phosphoethanolaminetransferase (alkaline phosphatase superfamily)